MATGDITEREAATIAALLKSAIDRVEAASAMLWRSEGLYDAPHSAQREALGQCRESIEKTIAYVKERTR